jgi:2'-hydroxyisoflavone reductase
VGPLDPTDRFTYWPARMDRGGEVLAPGDGSDPVQVMDGRDLAEWMLRAVEGKLTGIFNATGPDDRLTMREMLEACRDASGRSDVSLCWRSWPELEAAGVAPWSDMPAWIPSVGESSGIGAVNCSRAIAAGLRFRPIQETARDTLAWWRSLPAERRASPKAGLSPEREADLLK